MYSFHVSILAVIAAALSMMIVGSFWYSPLLFGKRWLSIMGMNSMQEMGSGWKAITKTYAGSIFVALLTSYVLALFQKNLFVPTLNEAVTVGFFVWLGTIAASYLNDHVYNSKRTPFELYLITIGFYLVAFTAQSILIFFLG